MAEGNEPRPVSVYFDNPTLLYDFSGTVETTVNLSTPANKFKFIIYRLKDNNNDAVNVLTLPYNLARNSYYRFYGKDSSTWGSVGMSPDGTQLTCNRTASTTNGINIYGYGEIN